MKKILIFLVCFSLILTGCNKNIDNMNLNEKIEYTLKNMTLEEKIAQMLIIYYTSSIYDATLSNTIKTYNPGGFILFSENISGHNQLLNFINKMQEDSKIPMFISIDQEGGLVQRLYPKADIEVSLIPAMSEVGKSGNPDEAYNIGKLIGKDLNKYGINVNFAPVIDVVSNEESFVSNRSFGNEVDLVSDMGIEIARGLREENVIPVFKHFPNHGAVIADSHYDLPVLNKSLEELKDHDFIPFKNAIKNNAEIIMIGHISVPQLDENTPASLSKVIITDILRNQLGFNGLVITDALNMGALTKNYSQEEILINTINAGVDLLLMPGSSKQTISIIKNAIETGKIKEEQINNSVKRILKLKFSNEETFKKYFEKNKKPLT